MADDTAFIDGEGVADRGQCVWANSSGRCHRKAAPKWDFEPTHPFVCEQHLDSVALFLDRVTARAWRHKLDAMRREWTALQRILRDENSRVYYLQREDGLIKIGVSRSLHSRMSSLEKEHGPLRIRALEYGTVVTERVRHGQFAHLRREGEWFEDGAELVAHCEWLADQAPEFRPIPAAMPTPRDWIPNGI